MSLTGTLRKKFSKQYKDLYSLLHPYVFPLRNLEVFPRNFKHGLLILWKRSSLARMLITSKLIISKLIISKDSIKFPKKHKQNYHFTCVGLHAHSFQVSILIWIKRLAFFLNICKLTIQWSTLFLSTYQRVTPLLLTLLSNKTIKHLWKCCT